MKPTKRDQILAAAERLLETGEAGGLTLEKIAEVAKVSKGGLLYHFPSKRAVYQAVIERMLARFNDSIEAYLAGNKEACYVEAMVHATLSEPISEACRGLTAVAVYDNSLLEPLREANKRWQKRLEEATRSEAIAIKIRFMLDGFFYARLFGLPLPSKAKLREVFETMCKEAS